MAKRFTETNKWDDPWYIDLPPDSKVFWQYLCDKCDNAGVIDISERHVKFLLNCETDINELLESLGNRIEKLKNGKYLIISFVEFQFGQLKYESNLHKNVILLLKKHDLYDRYFKGSNTLHEGLSKGTSKGIYKGKGKGIGKNKGKGKGKEQLFKDSDYFEFIKFESEILKNDKYSCFDIPYYHESIINWSDEGNTKKNWIATARSWMLSDYKNSKAKLITNEKQNNGLNGLTAEQYFASKND